MDLMFFLLGVAIIGWIIRSIDASGKPENWSRPYQRQPDNDQIYSDAFLALDAAEDGIFTPWGANAVRRADHALWGYTDAYHDEGDEGDSNWDEPIYDDREEAEDHWGPV